jgi:ribosomal protein S18 acetylase RimI-like enzyme
VYTASLRVEHRSRVDEILRSTGMFLDDEVDVALEVLDEGLGAGSPNSDYLLLGVFSDDDQMLGYAAYGPTPDTDRTYDLYWIAVDRAAQGMGAGSFLLDDIEHRLERAGARLLVLETSSRTDYAATRGFYHRRGFVEAARVGAFYAPGDDRVIFTKRFTSRPDAGRGVETS